MKNKTEQELEVSRNLKIIEENYPNIGNMDFRKGLIILMGILFKKIEYLDKRIKELHS